MRSTAAGTVRALLALLLAVTLSGCELLDLFDATPGVEFEELDPAELAPGEELSVPIEVEAGADGGTLAFVPVYFGEQGPFSFALDTGAAHSVIDEKVVEEARLALTGETRSLSGISGLAEAKHVQVDAWRVGDVALPPLEVSSMLLAAGDDHTMRGLLGSDVLSGFDRVTIDYVEGRLVLQPKA